MFGKSRMRFRLRQRATSTPPAAGHQVATWGIGPAGEAAVLWSGDIDAAMTVDHPPHERRAVVLEQSSTPEFPLVQPLPHGGFLVVGARAYWREGSPDLNAVLYAADGSVERRACLGDGIEHVQTAGGGSIWTGYFDEGVYGNYGWGAPDGPAPIGAPGIVRFSPTLDVEWTFPVEDLEPIDDCYALNVAGEDAWACYYSSFDIVRIRDGVVRSWGNEVEGARAIVVSDDSIALFGGYGKDRDRLVIGRLEDDDLEVTTTTRLTMPNGRPLPQDAVVIGRGEELHALVGLEWLTWSLVDHT